MGNVSDKSFREHRNTFSVQYFSFENLALFLDNVENYFRAGRATDDSMAHALCMLDT
jgi:hypothetical protein